MATLRERRGRGFQLGLWPRYANTEERLNLDGRPRLGLTSSTLALTSRRRNLR
ncbi:hypothetical protein [Moorena producens]|uniref:hypothetical protein n=1 Tax=Moorena producens TaxID=1155739 RepID=UPI003C78E6FB